MMLELSHIEQWMQRLRPYALSLIAQLQHVDLKADGTPVTHVDTSIELFLRQQIMQDFPQDGIIGEEMAVHNPTANRQWIIDPIDGTRALVAGRPTFTTLIALTEHGAPVASAMLQPVTGEYWMSDGHTTTLNEVRILCEPVDALVDAHFSTTSADLFREIDKPNIQTLITRVKSAQFGQDGYAYGRIAKGELHLVVESGLKPYDFLPLVPIITGSGGLITDWQGQPLTLNSSGDVIAASSQSLHNQVRALLKTL